MNTNKDKTENQKDSSENNQTDDANNDSTSNCCDRSRSSCNRRRWVYKSLFFIGIFAVGILTGSLFSHYSDYKFHKVMHGYHSEIYDDDDLAEDASEVSEHLTKKISRKLSKYNFQDAQEDKIETILNNAIQTNIPLVQQLHGQHQRVFEILSAATIDASAVEQFRADQVEVFDQISRNISGSVVEIAQTLTPEQRTALMAKWQKHYQKHNRNHDDDDD